MMMIKDQFLVPSLHMGLMFHMVLSYTHILESTSTTAIEPQPTTTGVDSDREAIFSQLGIPSHLQNFTLPHMLPECQMSWSIPSHSQGLGVFLLCPGSFLVHSHAIPSSFPPFLI